MAEQPTPPRTSSAVEDYLERISELIKTKGYARVVDIAAELKISQASVTTMVQRLDDQGLVKYEKYRGMVLTSAGAEVAARIAAGEVIERPASIAHRHELLTNFLTLLGLEKEVVDHDVEGMEHHVSPETFESLEKLNRYLEAHPEVLAAIKK